MISEAYSETVYVADFTDYVSKEVERTWKYVVMRNLATRRRNY